MSGLASLPDEVLKLILQKVPLTARLGSCSLVSKRLHQQAAAATDFIDINQWGSPGKKLGRADSFLLWLDRHGQHVTYLSVGLFPRALFQQLPCANLRALLFDECTVQLDPADGHPGVIQGLTKLTYLELACITTLRAPENGVVLDSLSQLPDLELLSVSADDRCVLSGATLAGLKRLTLLTLDEMTDENLAQLPALTALEVLRLSAQGPPVGPGRLPGLPPSLTSLSLESTVAGDMLSLLPTGLQDLHIVGGVLGPAEGPGSLLAGLARLQRLTALELAMPGVQHWPAPGPAYSALTASSGLVVLELFCNHLPAGVWPYVFPAGHRLPHLTSLVVCQDVDQIAPPQAAWGATEVSCLVSCCPQLLSLDLTHLQAGRHVRKLRKLSALTYLRLSCDSGGDADAAEEYLHGLAAATQLRDLRCTLRGGWGGVSVLPLTSLTALTSFTSSVVDPVTHDHDTISFPDEDTAVQATPVWLQLLGHCAAQPACRDEALQSLAEQLDGPEAGAVHKAVTVDLQRQLGSRQQRYDQQLAVLEARLWQRQHQQERLVEQQAAQIADQAARIADLQQQLEEQQQVAEQQAGQIAGLQAQLQELLQRLPAV